MIWATACSRETYFSRLLCSFFTFLGGLYTSFVATKWRNTTVFTWVTCSCSILFDITCSLEILCHITSQTRGFFWASRSAVYKQRPSFLWATRSAVYKQRPSFLWATRSAVQTEAKFPLGDTQRYANRGQVSSAQHAGLFIKYTTRGCAFFSADVNDSI